MSGVVAARLYQLEVELAAHDRDGKTTITLGVPTVAALTRIALATIKHEESLSTDVEPAEYNALLVELDEAVEELSRVVDQQSQT